MYSNIKRAVTLTLLVSAASPVLAAPAPVSDLNPQAVTTSHSLSVSNETEVQRLERLLNNSNRVQLRLQQQIDDMTTDMDELRGKLEKNNHDMQQMLDRQRELFVEQDRLRNQLKNNNASATIADDSHEKAGTFSANVDEQTAYQNAVDLILKKRDYNAAITAFTQFQKDFPDSTFSANSHYWLGQLYFAKRQDKDAVKSFAAVVSFAKSNKRPDALVKLGDIAARNNNQAQALKYYQQVVDEYPNSGSAELAKKHL